MIKKRIKFRPANTKMHIDVLLFDTKQDMEDYTKNNSDWPYKDKEFEKEPQAYFQSQIFTKIKNKKEIVRKKIGEIVLNKERLCYSLIAHECLHAVIYYFYRIGDKALNFNDDIKEESFCEIHQNLFFDVLCWLKDNKIKLGKYIK